MKKTIIALLILVFAASSCFAAFIQIGPTARYNGSYTDVEEMKDIKNYEFGADARVNLASLVWQPTPSSPRKTTQGPSTPS